MHCAAVISRLFYITPNWKSGYAAALFQNVAPLHSLYVQLRCFNSAYLNFTYSMFCIFLYKICDCYSGSIRWGWSQTAQTQQRGYDPTFSVEITIYLLIKAFRTYVRPILEYSRPVWSPHTIGMINSIEWVQRRFTKKLVGMPSLTYDERCASLRLDRLELRRLHSDLFNLF